MKCLILAGGMGSRLGNITRRIPKPLVKVAGIPVIDYVIEQLKVHGIDEIMVNVHYKHEQIMEHLGNTVLYSYEPKLLNTAGSVKRVMDWFDYEILVVNADTISNANYGELIKAFHLVRPNAMVLARNNVCAGAYVISKRQAGLFEEGKSIDECLVSGVRHYNQPDLIYHDCGTLVGLLQADTYYANL